jgi:hypothetical protein
MPNIAVSRISRIAARMPRLPLMIAGSLIAILLISWSTPSAVKAPDRANAELVVIDPVSTATVNRDIKSDRIASAASLKQSEPFVAKATATAPIAPAILMAAAPRRPDATPPLPVARPCLGECDVVVAAAQPVEFQPPQEPEYNAGAPVERQSSIPGAGLLRKTSGFLVTALGEVPIAGRLFR